MIHIAGPLPLARGSFPRFGNTPPQPDTWHRDSSFSEDAIEPSDSSVAAGSRSSTPLEVSKESSKNLRNSPAPHGEHCALIPGLSDDVALLCLARIGRSTWPACRAVSASWNSLFSSPAYHALRTTLGTTEPWLYVRGLLKGTPVSSWHALDLQSATWHSLPPLPACAVTTAGSRSTVLDGCLYVVGGMELNHSTAVASVYRYDPLSATWTHCPPLGTPRGYSAVEGLAGGLYVAGGNGHRGCEITSVENYTPPLPIPPPPSQPEAAGGDGRKIGEVIKDELRCAICRTSTDSRTGNGMSGWILPAPNSAPAPAPAPAPIPALAARGWQSLSPLPSEMASFDSVVVRGEIFVTEGWHWPYHYSPRGFIFNPGGGGVWRTMPLPLSEGWVGRAVNRDGQFLMLHTEQGLARASDGTARCAFIEEFDFKTATWRGLEASPFPREVMGKLRVALIHDKVVVVGEELQVALGSMRGVEAQGVPEVSWEFLPTSKRPTNVDPEVCHVIVS